LAKAFSAGGDSGRLGWRMQAAGNGNRKAEEIAARREAIEAAMLHLDDSNKRAPIDEKNSSGASHAYRDRLST